MIITDFFILFLSRPKIALQSKVIYGIKTFKLRKAYTKGL